MLPRCYLLVKHACHHTVRPNCGKKCFLIFNVAVRQFHSLYTKEIIAASSKFGAVRNLVFTPYLQIKKNGPGNEVSASSVDTKKSQVLLSAPIVMAKDTDLNKNATAAVSNKEPGTEGLVVTGKASKEGDPKSQEGKDDNVPTVVKKRKKIDVTQTYLDRNFITPLRAAFDFMLKPSDLETLPKTKRRSPYENEPPLTVYWRKDVEAKAILTWGSKEGLEIEKKRRHIEKRKYGQFLFALKKRDDDYESYILDDTPRKNQSAEEEKELGLYGPSGKVVLTAIAINLANCVFKLCAWCYTGSQSMFSEMMHSVGDTLNQIILAYGIHKSTQGANSTHPYGYTNMKYVASLISGVGILCVGTGLSYYHGVTALLHPEPLTEISWALFVLGGSLISEGATWIIAFNSIRNGAKKRNMSIYKYIVHAQDPSVNVVLLEDSAAVVGVCVAALCIGLSINTPAYDAIGCIVVGSILGSVAAFLIQSNVAALVGRSISEKKLQNIKTVIESDVMVRAIYDVKGIDMGSFLVRYKAEIDFDGRQLTKAYLDKQDIGKLLEEFKNIESPEKLEEYLLMHGENIVDMLGGEIDRIETKLKTHFPEIRHCDLEIL